VRVFLVVVTRMLVG